MVGRQKMRKVSMATLTIGVLISAAGCNEARLATCPDAVPRNHYREMSPSQRAKNADGLPPFGEATPDKIKAVAREYAPLFARDYHVRPSDVVVGNGYGFGWKRARDGRITVEPEDDRSIEIHFQDRADCPTGAPARATDNGVPFMFLYRSS